MKTKQFNFVQLPDGNNAIILTEQPSKQLGIVDVATVKRLAEMLPSVPFRDIKQVFISKIADTHSLAEMVEAIREEFNFHTTVNLLSEYKEETQQKETTIVKEM